MQAIATDKIYRGVTLVSHRHRDHRGFRERFNGVYSGDRVLVSRLKTGDARISLSDDRSKGWTLGTIPGKGILKERAIPPFSLGPLSRACFPTAPLRPSFSLALYLASLDLSRVHAHGKTL